MGLRGDGKNGYRESGCGHSWCDGGLGRVATHSLAERGARLALFSRNAERLEQLAAELHLPEDRRLIRAVDLTDPAAAQAAADAVIEQFGRAEILLHLVGGWAGGKPVTEVAPAVVSNMLQQHLWTTLHMAQAFVPHLVANRWGSVIVISSSAVWPALARRSNSDRSKCSVEIPWSTEVLDG